MDLEPHILKLQADVAILVATVTTISEDVKALKANAITVKLDLAQYRGAVIGGLFVLTAISATITWLWPLL